MEGRRIKFSKDGITDILYRVKQTVVYEYYKDFDEELELSTIMNEIKLMLQNGLTIQQIIFINNIEVYEDDGNDYKKIAMLCLQLVFKDIVQENRKRFDDLKKNKDFSAAFEAAKREILLYLLQIRDEFPVSAVKCAFLLIDGDVNPIEQRLTAQHLLLECLPYATTPEQRMELHTSIWDARL